jgi:hypothetical protein
VVGIAGAACTNALFVVWTDTRSVSLDVYAQRVLDDGTIAAGWDPDGQPVCVAPGDQTASDLLQFRDRLVVGWSDTRDGDAHAWVGGLLDDGMPIPGWEDGIRLSAASGCQSGPLLAWSVGDGVIAAWRDGRNAGATEHDIYAQTVNRFGEVGVQLTGVPAPRPESLRLLPPRPDPSSGSVVFTVEQPAAGHLRADVLDVAGRRLRTLHRGAVPAGRIELDWDGRAAGGGAVPAGVYVLRIESGGAQHALRFTRLR